MSEENIPEKSAGVNSPTKIIAPSPVPLKEPLPAFNQFGDGIEDCVDFETFGNPAHFRQIGEQIIKHHQQPNK